jgi:D-alanine transaminase
VEIAPRAKIAVGGASQIWHEVEARNKGTAMRTVYVNGSYVPENEAKISVFDRGFLFGDGIYEVASVLGGKLIDFPAHIARLHRSAGELGMRFTVSDDDLLAIHRELVSRNKVEEGVVYLQMTRGAIDRDFLFDTEKLTPTLVLFTQSRPLIDTAVAKNGMKIVSIPDLRWGRCDIKTVQLLYPSLGKMEAKARGADDAWMVRDGVVTEGTSNNAFIVTKDGAIVTRPLSHSILPGITRAALMAYSEAKRHQDRGARIHHRGSQRSRGGFHHLGFRLCRTGDLDRWRRAVGRQARPGHAGSAQDLYRGKPQARPVKPSRAAAARLALGFRRI